jgi:ABC-type glycerol-3-phosphate transport system substrate-binding protein
LKTIAKLLTLTALLACCLSCRSNRSADQDKITITFWHSFVSSTIPALNQLIAKFEAEHPRLTIKAQYVPTGDALIQKLITAVQSKTAPDISWIHADFLENLVKANAIYDMDHFIKAANGLTSAEVEDIYPALWQYAAWRGTIYSLPMEATNLALLYNKDLFRAAGLDTARPPRTWEELSDYAAKLTVDKNNDGKFEQIGFFLPVYPAAGPVSGWMQWQWMPFLWQAGGELIDPEQSHVLYNSSAGMAALQLWQRLYQAQQLNTFTSDYDVAFASRRLAMAMDGPWNLPRFKELLKNINWAIAPLPAGPRQQVTIVGGEYLAIFRQSLHPNEAWEFLKWIIRPDVQAMWSMKSGYLPVRHAVKTIPEFQQYLTDHPNFKVFVDQMEHGQAQKPIDYYGLQISRHIAEAIEKATLGQMEVRQALDEAAQKSDALLSSVK